MVTIALLAETCCLFLYGAPTASFPSHSDISQGRFPRNLICAGMKFFFCLPTWAFLLDGGCELPESTSSLRVETGAQTRGYTTCVNADSVAFSLVSF